MRSVCRFLCAFIATVLICAVLMTGCGGGGSSSGGNSGNSTTSTTTTSVNTNSGNNNNCGNYMDFCNPRGGGPFCCQGRYCEYSLGINNNGGRCL
jgi:hypothetical protein